MRSLTAQFMLDPASPAGTPRVGIVTFNGPPIGRLEDFTEAEASRLLVGLTSNGAQINAAITSRPMSTGTTCISCGLLRAQQHLQAARRPNALGVVIVLTDGAQTVGGDDFTAIEYANRVKADGHTVFTIGFGQAVRNVMEQMASVPASAYALDAYTLTRARSFFATDPLKRMCQLV